VEGNLKLQIIHPVNKLFIYPSAPVEEIGRVAKAREVEKFGRRRPRVRLGAALPDRELPN